MLSFDDEQNQPTPFAAEVVNNTNVELRQRVDALVNVDTSKRVNASDKRMINALTDVNQLVPFKYKWAWDMYLQGCNNHWMPQETDLKVDTAQVQNGELTEQERHIVGRNLNALAHDGLLKSGAVALGVYRHLTAPEARQYLLRQSFEESLMVHVHAHVTAAVPIVTRSHPILADKQEFFAPYADVLTSSQFKTGSFESDQRFLKTMVAYACIMKGMFSLVDFTQLLSLGQQGKVPGMSELARLLVRDQVMHCNFGIEVIQAIKNENPGLWTTDLKRELVHLFRLALELETEYVQRIAPTEVTVFRTYLQVVANRRAAQIGLDPIFTSAKNPFPWMGKLLGLRQDDTTFDTKKVENKVSSTLEW